MRVLFGVRTLERVVGCGQRLTRQLCRLSRQSQRVSRCGISMVSQMLCTWEAVCALCGPKIAATPLRSKWHTEIKQRPPLRTLALFISSYLQFPFALDYTDFRKLAWLPGKIRFSQGICGLQGRAKGGFIWKREGIFFLVDKITRFKKNVSYENYEYLETCVRYRRLFVRDSNNLENVHHKPTHSSQNNPLASNIGGGEYLKSMKLREILPLERMKSQNFRQQLFTKIAVSAPKRLYRASSRVVK